jgi:hypothetical protein
MAIDPAECRTWAQEAKAAWELAPLLEQRKDDRIQVGFELTLYARMPAGAPPGPERQAAVERLWDRLRDVAESLLPLAGADARIEVDPFEAAARLRPETQFAPEILLSARVFHGADLLVPVREGDREQLKPLEDRLHELGLKARSW